MNGQTAQVANRRKRALLTTRDQEWLHGDGSNLGFEDDKIFNGQSWWGGHPSSRKPTEANKGSACWDAR